MSEKRIELHAHSLLGEGVLLPSEIARRCEEKNYRAVAITEHVDDSNIGVIKKIVNACRKISKKKSKGGGFEIDVIPGAEITHAPVKRIKTLVKKARKLGAEVVLVHGETIAEPVKEGTNKAAIEAEIDILAHPGIISVGDAELARANNVFLELSARKGHCLANGHIAKVARETKAELVLNADAHAPEDFISQEKAFYISLGSGLSEAEAIKTIKSNPEKILRKLGY